MNSVPAKADVPHGASHRTAFRRASSSRQLLLSGAALAMLGFVAATNRWVNWNQAVHRYHDGDPISYRVIAAAAPGLPHRRVAEWHAERFLPNYIVGSFAKLLHAGLSPTYRVACVVVAVAICFALAELLSRLPVSPALAVVGLAVFILNPYGLRYFFFGVGRIADLVFILGAVLAVRGLALRAPISLLAGLVIATTGRQTALPAAVAAGVVMLADPAWQAGLGRRRSVLAVAVVLVPAAIYALIRVVAAPFSGPDPGLQTMTILGADNVSALLDHLARSAIPLVPVGAMLGAIGWIRHRRRKLGAPPMGSASREPGDVPPAYGCLLFGASVALQPALLNPAWASDSEPRLAVLGVAPLAVALVLFIADSALEDTRLEILLAGALVGLLALGSLHHIFTLTGPADKAQTVALESGVAATAGVLLIYAEGGRRRHLRLSAAEQRAG